MTAPKHLAIIAGNGVYPEVLARAARAAGVGEIGAIAFSGETKPALSGLVDKIVWLRVGQLQRMLAALKEWKMHHAIMAGQIAPRNLFDLRPDWRALLLLARLKQRNAESIFGAIAHEMAKIEVELLPATTFLEEHLATRGLMAGPKLSRRELNDVEFGWEIAKPVAALDIGQTILVKNGTVLAVEAFEGTNETVRRGGTLGRHGAVMVKVAKAKQDPRFDIPVVGPETLRAAAEAKVKVIAVEHGQTLLLERDRLLALADDLGVSLFGR